MIYHQSQQSCETGWRKLLTFLKTGCLPSLKQTPPSRWSKGDFLNSFPRCRKVKLEVFSLSGFTWMACQPRLKADLFTGSFQHDWSVILIFFAFCMHESNHVYCHLRGYFILDAYTWWTLFFKSVFCRTCQATEWLPTCLIQSGNVIHHCDWEDNKRLLPSSIRTHCTDAQPEVIMFLTMHVIMWLLPRHNDTVFCVDFNCIPPCMFSVNKCFIAHIAHTKSI